MLQGMEETIMRKHHILSAAAAMLLSFGTGTGAFADEEPASGGTFTYARSDSTTSFDLHQEITENNAFAIDKVFESLVTFDNDGNIIDWLAESHEISDDGLVYTFTLQDGLKFSDGSDVTAEDVKFSIERHLEVGGSLPIEADVESVEALDEKTVQITLGSAYTPFLSELANFSNGIIPKDFAGKTEEEFFKDPIGTGPFVVSEWDPSGDLTFTKNAYYWQEGKPYLDELVYKVVDDDNQALNQLLAGEIDGIEDLSLSNAANIESNAETKTATSYSYNVEEVFFNTLDEHFSDEHVRRALAMAIDREALTQALTFGYAEVANTVLPRALLYQTNDTVDALTYDIDAAKEELALSAYPDGFDTTISIASGNNTRLQEAQIIQAAGAQIGINIEINAQEISTFRADFRELNFSMMINSATADYPDANSIFAFQVDPDGWSKCYWTSYQNEEAAELMREGQVTPDGEDRAAVYEELQQILADDVPYIPLYNSENVLGLRDNVEGLTVLPNGSVRFEDVYFEE